MEQKAVESLKRSIKIEDMGEYIDEEDILMPTELVSEIKTNKRTNKTEKTTRKRKLYPGYIFVRVKLYDEDDNILEKPLSLIRAANGVINFMGDNRPIPLKKSEVEEIFKQINQGETVEKPKLSFNVGEEVKINEGPFQSFTGCVDEIDPERGKLKVSVSIFGRFTPVELDYAQVSRVEENQ